MIIKTLVVFRDADGPKGGCRWVGMDVDITRWERGEVCGYVLGRATTMRELLASLDAKHVVCEVYRTHLARYEGRTDTYLVRGAE